MDWAFLVAIFAVAVTAFILGRVLGIRDLVQLRDEHEKLKSEHTRLTDRDAKGRFTKRS